MAKADLEDEEQGPEPVPVTVPLAEKFEFDFQSDDDSESCQQANRIISHIDDDLENLPEALLELLTTVIKPLFLSSQSRVTPAGRKPAYGPTPILSHSAAHQEEPPAWRQRPVTVPLLQWILKAYWSLPQPQRRQVLEAQFHLLVPPILKLIDDVPARWRADGFSLLQLLCKTITFAQSEDILKRTGLVDVCFDAITPNFMLLPTLTPEEESLQVLQQLYPAALSLVQARFGLDQRPGLGKKGEEKNKDEQERKEDEQAKQKYLKIILRHGLLASLNHLGVGSSVSHVPLATFLLSQLTPTIYAMGLPAVVHLNRCIPMLRAILVDPFATSVPELLQAALDGMATMIKICSPRIKDKWWSECLYGLVGCWCNVVDVDVDGQDDHNDASNGDGEGLRALSAVKGKARAVVQMLGETVDAQQWRKAVQALCDEERDVEGLFMP